MASVSTETDIDRGTGGAWATVAGASRVLRGRRLSSAAPGRGRGFGARLRKRERGRKESDGLLGWLDGGGGGGDEAFTLMTHVDMVKIGRAHV